MVTTSYGKQVDMSGPPVGSKVLKGSNAHMHNTPQQEIVTQLEAHPDLGPKDDQASNPRSPSIGRYHANDRANPTHLVTSQDDHQVPNANKTY